MANALFAREPFRERRRDFNVWGLCAPAAEAGVARPSADIHRRTPVGATYDIFGSERYVLTYQNRAFRDVAAWAPYEFVTILVNSATYGGGGLYNVFSTAAVDSAWADYLFVHEFAHHFAALADEYYTSPVAYTTPATRRRAVGAERHGAAAGHAAQVGRPGHAGHAGADAVAEGAVRGLPADRPGRSAPGCGPTAGPRPRWTRSSARSSPSRPARFEAGAGVVGAFQGAYYDAGAYYRPEVDCVMFTRNLARFCAVCRRVLADVIARHLPSR